MSSEGTCLHTIEIHVERLPAPAFPVGNSSVLAQVCSYMNMGTWHFDQSKKSHDQIMFLKGVCLYD